MPKIFDAVNHGVHQRLLAPSHGAVPVEISLRQTAELFAAAIGYRTHNAFLHASHDVKGEGMFDIAGFESRKRELQLDAVSSEMFLTELAAVGSRHECRLHRSADMLLQDRMFDARESVIESGEIAEALASRGITPDMHDVRIDLEPMRAHGGGRAEIPFVAHVDVGDDPEATFHRTNRSVTCRGTMIGYQNGPQLFTLNRIAMVDTPDFSAIE